MGQFVARPVDAHLLRRVLKPSGVGRLEPFILCGSRGRAGGPLVRKALNDNPVAQIARARRAGGGGRLPADDQGGQQAVAASRPAPRRPPRRRRHAGARDDSATRRRRDAPPARLPPRLDAATPCRPSARRADAPVGEVRGRAGASRAGGQGLRGRQDGRPARVQAPRDRRRRGARERRAAARPKRPGGVRDPRRPHRALLPDHRGRGREPRSGADRGAPAAAHARDARRRPSATASGARTASSRRFATPSTRAPANLPYYPR